MSADQVIEMMDTSTTQRRQDATDRLDTPNGHIILELSIHTIPCFGHARHCSEMVLEMENQGFKEWLKRNKHLNAHLTVVQKSLARD